MNLSENENNFNMSFNFIDGAHLKPEELLRRLILLDFDHDLLEEMDFASLIDTYNNIVSTSDNLRLSKIRNLLEQESQRRNPDFDFDFNQGSLLKKRQREIDEEYFPYNYNENPRELNFNLNSISPGQSGSKR